MHGWESSLLVESVKTWKPSSYVVVIRGYKNCKIVLFLLHITSSIICQLPVHIIVQLYQISPDNLRMRKRRVNRSSYVARKGSCVLLFMLLQLSLLAYWKVNLNVLAAHRFDLSFQVEMGHYKNCGKCWFKNSERRSPLDFAQKSPELAS